jgi:hypothetical protein
MQYLKLLGGGQSGATPETPGSVGRSWLDLQPPSDEQVQQTINQTAGFLTPTPGARLPHQLPEWLPQQDVRDAGLPILRAMLRNAGTDASRALWRRYGPEATGSPSGSFIQPPAGTTGDITWQRLDPKTWYLSNQQPSSASGALLPATPTTTTLPDANEQFRRYAEQNNLSQAERDILRRYISGYTPTTTTTTTTLPTPEQKKQWRGDLRDLNKLLRQDEKGASPYTGIPYSDRTLWLFEKLINTGGLVLDAGGTPSLDSRVGGIGGTKGRDRFTRLADYWRDFASQQPR